MRNNGGLKLSQDLIDQKPVDRVIDNLYHPIINLGTHPNQLILIRGLVGSGKSTLARIMIYLAHARMLVYKYEAASFFMQEDGSYLYNSKYIALAQRLCLFNAQRGMQMAYSHVIIANNFTMLKTMDPYLEMAAKYNRQVVVICAKGAYEPTLNYSPQEIEWIRASFEQYPDEYEFRMHFNENVSTYADIERTVSARIGLKASQ